MAPPAKRRPALKAKRIGKPLPKSTGSSKPFLRCTYPAALRDKTLSVLGALEQSQDATVHRAALADVVVKLTSSGMDAYFMKPLEDAQAGFIVKQSANLGLAGVQQMMASAIRNILGRMDGPQLLSVCGSIRQFML